MTAALQTIMPPGVDPLVLFRTLAVNERVFLRLMAGGLLDRGSITLREREIVIDRTCAPCGWWTSCAPAPAPACARPRGGVYIGPRLDYTPAYRIPNAVPA